MKVLVFGDVHGKIDALSDVIKNIKTKPDLVICPGDFTDMFEKIEGFSQLDIADIIIQKISSFGCPVLCVPGNHDPYEILKMFDNYKTNIHGKRKDVGGLTFIGWGGALTPFNTYFEPSENETKNSLEKLVKGVGSGFVLVVHNPPKNTKLDKTLSGTHVGSNVIRRFIEKYKPLLCVSAHIHEAGGIDKIGETTLFYPGPIYEGKYGIINIKGKNVKCEIKN